MTKKLNIIHIASEVHPFTKTGGLADVVRSLPKAQKRLGHNVCIFTPFYEKVIDQKKHKFEKIISNFKIDTYKGKSVRINVLKNYLMANLPVYFIQNTKFFSRKKSLYGSIHENARFYLFNTACIEIINKLDIRPDIIHCHDWHSGLIPYLLKTKYKKSELNKTSSTVFTIHNLIFQMGRNWWKINPKKRDSGGTSLPNFDDPKLENINFAKRAILNSDAINTVSESHVEEIMTKKYGQDLNRILSNRKERIFGIVNGIDYYDYSPLKDHGIRKKFSYKSISLKKHNKLYLQKKLKLKQDETIPIIGMTSRITEQKGFELVMEKINHLLELNLQFIIMGDGDKNYINEFKKLNKKHSEKFKWLPFDHNFETSIYAGSDLLLLPSRYEPCGINILIAMRYGCIPIVHPTGGLADAVANYNPMKSRGTGFALKNYSGRELYITIVKALEHFKHKKDWEVFVKKIMQISSSWEIPAKKYIKLYQKAIEFHKTSLNNKIFNQSKPRTFS